MDGNAHPFAHDVGECPADDDAGPLGQTFPDPGLDAFQGRVGIVEDLDAQDLGDQLQAADVHADRDEADGLAPEFPVDDEAQDIVCRDVEVDDVDVGQELAQLVGRIAARHDDVEAFLGDLFRLAVLGNGIQRAENDLGVLAAVFPDVPFQHGALGQEEEGASAACEWRLVVHGFPVLCVGGGMSAVVMRSVGGRCDGVVRHGLPAGDRTCSQGGAAAGWSDRRTAGAFCRRSAWFPAPAGAQG